MQDEGMYLKPSYVFDQQPFWQSVKPSQGRKDVVDKVEKRFCTGIAAVPRGGTEDSIRLARRGHEPEVGSIGCQNFGGDSA